MRFSCRDTIAPYRPLGARVTGRTQEANAWERGNGFETVTGHPRTWLIDLLEEITHALQQRGFGVGKIAASS